VGNLKKTGCLTRCYVKRIEKAPIKMAESTRRVCSDLHSSAGADAWRGGKALLLPSTSLCQFIAYLEVYAGQVKPEHMPDQPWRDRQQPSLLLRRSRRPQHHFASRRGFESGRAVGCSKNPADGGCAPSYRWENTGRSKGARQSASTGRSSIKNCSAGRALRSCRR